MTAVELLLHNQEIHCLILVGCIFSGYALLNGLVLILAFSAFPSLSCFLPFLVSSFTENFKLSGYSCKPYMIPWLLRRWRARGSGPGLTGVRLESVLCPELWASMAPRYCVLFPLPPPVMLPLFPACRKLMNLLDKPRAPSCGYAGWSQHKGFDWETLGAEVQLTGHSPSPEPQQGARATQKVGHLLLICPQAPWGLVVAWLNQRILNRILISHGD